VRELVPKHVEPLRNARVEIAGREQHHRAQKSPRHRHHRLIQLDESHAPTNIDLAHRRRHEEGPPPTTHRARAPSQ
jgi:hypothetical protein